MGIKKQQLLAINLIFISLLNVTTVFIIETKSAPKMHFTLTAIGRDQSEDMMLLYRLKDYLAQIRINLNTLALSWPDFVGQIIGDHNYDLISYPLYPSNQHYNFTDYATLFGLYYNGFLWGYHEAIDWDNELDMGKNEWYIQEFARMTPGYSSERIEHYYNWQNHLMDKVIPIKPLYQSKSHLVSWSNLNGFNVLKGLYNSWSNLTWDGLHTNQQSINEIVIEEYFWEELNPLFDPDVPDELLLDGIFDSLVKIDGDQSYWPHLATNWLHLNETTVRFSIRENVKWQIDQDNLFPNEYLDARDVYFTLYCYKNLASEFQQPKTIKDFRIIDNLTLDIFFDGNANTIENEPTGEYLYELEKLKILPEHYLNQTQLIDGTTPNISHSSWSKFSNHCFGTGLFEFSSFSSVNNETILSLFNDCWFRNSSLSSDPDLNWLERYPGNWLIEDLRIKHMDYLEDSISVFKDGYLDIQSVTNENDRVYYSTNPDFKLYMYPSVFFRIIAFNIRANRNYIGSLVPCESNPSISKGLAIRKAISYIIDRTDLNDYINNNDYLETYHPLPLQGGIWLSPTILKYDYSLSNALFYMNLAGYNISALDPIGTSQVIGLESAIFFISIPAIFVTIVLLRRKQEEK